MRLTRACATRLLTAVMLAFAPLMVARKLVIASSPVETIGDGRLPMLVVRTDDVRNVPWQQSTQLIEGLRPHSVPFEQMLPTNAAHDLTRYTSWLAIFYATDTYLAKYLHPASKAEQR